MSGVAEAGDSHRDQKREAFGQLATGVAHDFNNIISVVLGYSELLLKTGSLTPEDRELVLQISDAGKRAAHLTRQLLTFSRKQRVHLQAADLNERIQDAVPMLRRILGKDVSLRTQLADDLSGALVDHVLLEQVMLNLALNARDAMPTGGELRVVTSTEAIDAQRAGAAGVAAGNYAVLRVSDTGVGMTPEVKARIFEPFFSTKISGKGTGLGLAVVQTVMVQHNGWVEAASEPGRGSSFTLFFPATALAAAGTAPVPPRPASPSTIPRPGASILIAEDDAAVRGLMVQILELQGYRVTVAESGRDALGKWKEMKGAFDLLLTDIMMPGGISGRELATHLRIERPDLPVLFMSGFAKDIPDQSAMIAKEGLLLQKPFTLDQLMGALRATLSKTG